MTDLSTLTLLKHIAMRNRGILIQRVKDTRKDWRDGTEQWGVNPSKKYIVPVESPPDMNKLAKAHSDSVRSLAECEKYIETVEQTINKIVTEQINGNISRLNVAPDTLLPLPFFRA